MDKLFSDADAAIGRPDIAINTVGKVLKKPIVDVTEAEYDEMKRGEREGRVPFSESGGKPCE